MRDGTVLRADVYRSSGSGPWPVLLSRLPYGKQTPMMTVMLDPLAAARRGFMVVIQGTRGRFVSDGEWEPWTYEEGDGYDTVRRAALRSSRRYGPVLLKRRCATPRTSH
ncbi:CocE/NonD family hydrolase [Streptomyces mirabilis]|uniref:CocE/NonD family hydrolase n=1 Tax=Streptomyces sp. NPDC005388 TaxID=3156717 RepID=UPI0033A3ED7F